MQDETRCTAWTPKANIVSSGMFFFGAQVCSSSFFFFFCGATLSRVPCRSTNLSPSQIQE